MQPREKCQEKELEQKISNREYDGKYKILRNLRKKVARENIILLLWNQQVLNNKKEEGVFQSEVQQTASIHNMFV